MSKTATFSTPPIVTEGIQIDPTRLAWRDNLTITAMFDDWLLQWAMQCLCKCVAEFDL
jgi:hypothetical protein